MGTNNPYLAEKEKKHDNTLWGKPANDIITGIGNIADAPPARAIWEMVQNARDVATNNHANIAFIREKDCLVFQHNGISFTNETLEALINQTSSKTRENTVQAGQYGTGFLVTHKFGLKFELSGSVKLLEDKEEYHHFQNFLLDRSTKDKDTMVKCLRKAYEQTSEWAKNPTVQTMPSDLTTFRYIHEYDIEKKNVKVAFEACPKIVPYVMALNPAIASIKFVDNVEGLCNIKYSYKNQQVLSETNLYKLVEKDYDCVNCIGEIGTESVLLLESVESDCKTGTPTVSVILPIIKVATGYKAIKMDNSVPRLFVYLPLMGTERWGINYIIHSPLFTCSSDNRDGLRLIGNGQNTDDEAQQNRKMIEQARTMIASFISENFESIDDAQCLAPVQFNIHASNETLAQYYVSQQRLWVETFSQIAISTNANGKQVKPQELVVMDKQLSDFVGKYKELPLMPMFFVLICKAVGVDRIPREQELAEWSVIIQSWYEGLEQEDNHFFSIEQLEEYINGKSIEVIGRENLLIFDQLLSCEGLVKPFEEYALIPNRKGKLRANKDGSLVVPIDISDEFLSILTVILPNDVDKFVDKDFEGITTLPTYTIENAHTNIGNIVEQYNHDVIKLHGNFIHAEDKHIYEQTNEEDIKKSMLTIEKRTAYMHYCTMSVNEDGISYNAETLKALRLINGFEGHPAVCFSSEQAKVSPTLLALTKDAFFRFSRMSREEQNANSYIISQLIGAIYTKNNERKNILEQYMIYPDETGCYKCASELYKQEGHIAERIKDIYDIVVCGNKETDENPKDSIRHKLLREDFADIFVSEKTKTSRKLADEIMEQFRKTSYPNVAGNPWREYILEILEHIGEDDWKVFEDIATKKNEILVSAIEDESKQESIYKLLKVEDADRLKLLADVAGIDNIASILEYGQKALQDKQNAEADFTYKEKLGNYVETLIKEQLQGSLDKLNIKVDCPKVDRSKVDRPKVENQQSGQDLIVYVNEKPVYFIEVKSRWSTDDSVRMSARQFERSVEEQERYALCEVDMTHEDHENVEKHVYPHVAETLSHIRAITDIGKLNSCLSATLDEYSTSVHVGGDYKVIVPQTVWNDPSHGHTFEELIAEIKRIIIE